MSERERFNKLLEHRNREVQLRVKDFAESVRAADRARLNLLQGQRKLQEASCARDDIWGSGSPAQILEEVDAWVMSRRRCAEQQVNDLHAAEAEREQQRARVVAARLNAKKVERLIERSALRERQQANRQERRFEDEMAARAVRS